MSGLTRVRQFIQDDAHIYVRPDQLPDELEALLGEVHEAYSWVGLVPRFAFATKPDKAIGDPALWEQAEAMIKDTLDRTGANYVIKPKDGTFYAPKIDIYIDDALGREWQMATIQADLTMLPERFDLTYIDEHGQPQRPIAIHRAIYGSLERFIGILVEHFAGAFPLWLARSRRSSSRSPTGTSRPPRSSPACFDRAGLRVEVDASSNRMQYKIRTAQEQKVPYMVVLGDREIEARTASPRTRAGEQQEPPSLGRVRGPAGRGSRGREAMSPDRSGASRHARRLTGRRQDGRGRPREHRGGMTCACVRHPRDIGAGADRGGSASRSSIGVVAPVGRHLERRASHGTATERRRDCWRTSRPTESSRGDEANCSGSPDLIDPVCPDRGALPRIPRARRASRRSASRSTRRCSTRTAPANPDRLDDLGFDPEFYSSFRAAHDIGVVILPAAATVGITPVALPPRARWTRCNGRGSFGPCFRNVGYGVIPE